MTFQIAHILNKTEFQREGVCVHTSELGIFDRRI